MSDPITGGCLCGAIRYSVSQAPDKVIACHCTHCQKASGSGASHNALVPSAAVSFTAGKFTFQRLSRIKWLHFTSWALDDAVGVER